MRIDKGASITALSVLVAACASLSRVSPLSVAAPDAATLPSGTQLIPTRYVTGRFFATPVTTGGDTINLFLDTGDSGRLFADAVARLGLAITSDSVNTAHGYRRMTSLPVFRSDRSLPDAIATSVVGTRIIVTPPYDAFDTLMSNNAIGQLGQLWFADRIWTFDYLRERLLLRRSMPPATADVHEVTFDFQSDTAGHAANHVPRVGVVVDGDSLLMLFDLGATVWLTDAALAEMHDGRPAERASSLVRASIVAKWRTRHPEWKVIAKASRVGEPDMIEVPIARIGGFDVGPVWFAALDDAGWPADIPRRVRIDGTLGGSGLQYFAVTLDYPHRIAQFSTSNER